VEFFDWDDAKNAKLTAERGIGFEDIVSISSVAICSTFWNIRTPTVAPASGSSTSCGLCPGQSVKTMTWLGDHHHLKEA
jgi:hypothetical protein